MCCSAEAACCESECNPGVGKGGLIIWLILRMGTSGGRFERSIPKALSSPDVA